MSTIAERRAAVYEAAQGVTKQYDRTWYRDRLATKGDVPELWQALADQGLLALGAKEDVGGAGGMVELVAAQEAIAEAGIPTLELLVTAFARTAVDLHGSDEQRHRWVAPTTTGELRMCFAITEPDAGTNSFAMSTTARRDGGTYVVNGSKIYISVADTADWMLLVCRTAPPGENSPRTMLSLLMVDMATPGITLRELDTDVGIADKQFQVYFDDVEVPAANLIGQEGDGARQMFDALNPERLLGAAVGVGTGQHALQRAVAYANERAPFGRPTGSYQAVAHPLAKAQMEIEAARQMMYAGAEAFEQGDTTGVKANMAKYLAAEAGTAACDAAIQAHGGYAFDRETDILDLWKGARLLKIAPINNEMLLNFVAEKVMGLPRSY